MNTKHEYTVKQTGMKFPYLQSLPEGYGNGEKFPLVIFLHGSGESGDGSNLDLVAVHGFPRYADEGEKYPFVLISPQCPIGKYWACFTESLNYFLDYLLNTLDVDCKRVYLTGLSLGGMGTWMWAAANPERFAAIAPVCGNGIVWNGAALRDIPVWAFHGEDDDAISVNESINMVNGVNKAGGSARLTVYPGVGHGCWTLAYKEPELVPWLLKHKKP